MAGELDFLLKRQREEEESTLIQTTAEAEKDPLGFILQQQRQQPETLQSPEEAQQQQLDVYGQEIHEMKLRDPQRWSTYNKMAEDGEPIEVIRSFHEKSVQPALGLGAPMPVSRKVPEEGLPSPTGPYVEELQAAIEELEAGADQDPIVRRMRSQGYPEREVQQYIETKYLPPAEGVAPINPDRVLTAMDALKESILDPRKLFPFTASLAELEQIADVASAARALEAGEAITPKEEELINRYIEQANADRTWGNKVVSILTQLPAFAGEFAITGGIYTGTKKLAEKGALKALEKVVKRGLLGKTLEIGAKVGARAIATVPHSIVSGVFRIPADVIQRTMPQLGTDEEGNITTFQGEEIGKATIKAFVNQWIETATERGGVLLRKLGPGIKAITPDVVYKSALGKLIRRMNKGVSDSVLKKIMDQAALGGPLEESFEERLADIARYAFGLDEKLRIPSASEFAAEMVAFSILPGAAKITDVISKKATERKAIREIERLPEEVKKELGIEPGKKIKPAELVKRVEERVKAKEIEDDRIKKIGLEPAELTEEERKKADMAVAYEEAGEVELGKQLQAEIKEEVNARLEGREAVEPEAAPQVEVKEVDQNQMDPREMAREELKTAETPRQKQLLEREIKSFSDPVMPEMLSYSGMQETEDYVQREKIPHIVVHMDMRGLGSTNQKLQSHEKANDAMRAIYQDIMNKDVQSEGGKASRGGARSDEMFAIIPNKSEAEVNDLFAEIDKKTTKKAKELGLDNIPHAKHQGLKIIGLTMNYGVAQGVLGKAGEGHRLAEERMNVMEDEYLAERAAEQGYTYNEESDTYVKGEQKLKAGIAGERRAEAAPEETPAIEVPSRPAPGRPGVPEAAEAGKVRDLTPEEEKMVQAVPELFRRLAAKKIISKNIKITPETYTEIKEPKRKDQQLVKKLSSDLGVNVAFVSVDPKIKEAGNFNGYYDADKNTIVINNKTDNPVMAVFGHELFHSLPKDLQDALVDWLKKNEKEAIDKYTKRVEIKTEGMTEEDFNKMVNEFGGDILGERFTQTGFWIKMKKDIPEVFKKLFDEIKRIIRKIRINTEYKASDLLANAEAVRDVMQRAVTEKVRRVRAARIVEGVAEPTKAELINYARDLRNEAVRAYDIEKKNDFLDIVMDRALAGGITLGKKYKDREEFKTMPKVVKKLFKLSGGKAFDEVAEDLGMSDAELISRLNDYVPAEKPPADIEYYMDEAKEMFIMAKRAEVEAPAPGKEVIEKAAPEEEIPFQEKRRAKLRKRFAEMERAAEREKQARKKAIDDLKKLLKKTNVSQLRPEYKQDVAPLLEIDPVAHRKAFYERYSKMLKHVEEHPDNMIPQDKIDKARKALERTNIADLETEDIQKITDSIKHFIHLNKLKNQYLWKGKYKDFYIRRNDALTRLKMAPEFRKSEDIDTRIKEETPGPLKRMYGISSENAELVTERLDKEHAGPIKELIYEGINYGTTEMYDFQQKAKDYFKKVFEGINISKWSEAFWKEGQWKKNIDYKTIALDSGKKITLTPAQRISFYLHSRNDRNMKHLLKGGFSFPYLPGTIYKISEEDIINIIDSMTDEEIKAADSIYKYFNEIQKEAINDIAVNLNGFEIAVEPEYFPIRTNALDRFRDELAAKKSTADIRNYINFTLEGMGIFQERTNANNALILDDAFVAVAKSSNQVSSFVGLAHPLRTAKMLIYDKQFSQTLTNTYGSHYLNYIKKYIQDIEGTYLAQEPVEKITTAIINKMDVGILGLNPWVIAKQPVSYALAKTEFNLKHWLAGSIKPESIEVMSKWSPQLRNRFEKGAITVELGEIGAVGAAMHMFTNKKTFSDKLTAGIRNFDYQAIGRIWKAAEAEVKENNPDLTGDALMEKIAERTEEVVRLTQPTYDIKDRSEIARSRQIFIRLATKYTTQRNKNFIILKRAIERFNRSDKKPKDYLKLIEGMLLVTIINKLLIDGIDRLRDWAYGRKKKTESENASISKRIIRSSLWTVGSFMQNIYFADKVTEAIESAYEKYKGYPISDPLMSNFTNFAQGTGTILKSIDQLSEQQRYKAGDKRGQLKYKKTLIRGIEKVASPILRLGFGIPYDSLKGLVYRIPKNIWEIIESKKEESKREELLKKFKK